MQKKIELYKTKKERKIIRNLVLKETPKVRKCAPQLKLCRSNTVDSINVDSWWQSLANRLQHPDITLVKVVPSGCNKSRRLLDTVHLAGERIATAIGLNLWRRWQIQEAKG